MAADWPVFTMDEEKANRTGTRFPGIFIIEDPEEPMFSLIVKEALNELGKLPSGQAILQEISHSTPSDNGGFKVLIKRIAVAFKHVEVDAGRRVPQIGGDPKYTSTQRGGRSYASGAQQRIGVKSEGASNGKGASVIVGYCPSSVFATDHGRGKKKGYVPTALLLGHELIHGLHCLKGTMKDRSIDIAGKSTSEEEAQTFGLGPYKDDLLTENKLRGEIPGLEQRLTYP